MFSIVFLLFVSQITFSQGSAIKDAKMHLENENFSAARKVLNAYIATAPKELGEAKFYLGESYYLDEKIDSAKTIWSTAVTSDNKSTYCRVGIGKLHLDDKKVAEAQKEFIAALKFSKESPDINYLIGQAFLRSKNPMPEQAVTYASKARDGDPKNSSYLVLLGDAYWAQNNGGNAMTNYELASERDASNAEVYVKMAGIWSRTSMADGEDRAITKLEEAIVKFPNYAPAYKDLVELYVRKGKSSKVTPLLEKYVQLAGTDLDARKRYVKYLAFQAKDYDKTIEEGNRVLNEDPKSFGTYRWLGWAFAEKKEYQQAFDAFSKYFEALDTILASATDYNYYAQAAANLGKFDVAANTYDRVLTIDPSKKEIYDLIAKMYFDNKKFPEAIASYKKKIANLGEKAADYVSLGRAYSTVKDYVNADSAFAKVNELAPTYVYAYYMRAQAAINIDTSGTLYLPKPHYDKIIELSATDEKFQSEKTYKRYLVEAYNYVAVYTFNTSSDPAQALAILEKSLAIDPQNKDALAYKDAIVKATTPEPDKGN